MYTTKLFTNYIPLLDSLYFENCLIIYSQVLKKGLSVGLHVIATFCDCHLTHSYLTLGSCLTDE